MRFRVSCISVAAAMVALALASAVSGLQWLVDCTLTVTVAIFVVTGIRAVNCHGRRRAFSAAFAIVGGGYLLIANVTAFSPLADSLLTNLPLKTLLKNRQAELEASFDGKAVSAPARNSDLGTLLTSVQSFKATGEQFKQWFIINHCIWACILGMIAGWYSSYLYFQDETIPVNNGGTKRETS